MSEGTDEEGRSVKGKELWPGLAIPPQFWKRRHTGRFSLENKISRLSGMKQGRHHMGRTP